MNPNINEKFVVKNTHKFWSVCGGVYILINSIPTIRLYFRLIWKTSRTLLCEGGVWKNAQGGAGRKFGRNLTSLFFQTAKDYIWWYVLEASLVAQRIKRPPAMLETRVQSWVGKIPWRRKWQPTPVFLPGESHGQRSLVGYSPWGRKELVGHDWATSHILWNAIKNLLHKNLKIIKLKIELLFYPAVQLLGIYLESTTIWRDAWTPVFIAALFAIVKTWKQPKCPSTEEWIKTMWYIYMWWNITHPFQRIR